MWNLQDFCPFMVSGANVPVFWGGRGGGRGLFKLLHLFNPSPLISFSLYTCSTQVRSFHFPFNCTQFKYMSKSTEKYMTGILYYVWKGLGEFNAANLKKNRVVYRLNIKYAVWHVAWKEAIWHHVTFPYLYLTYFAPQGSIDMNF